MVDSVARTVTICAGNTMTEQAADDLTLSGTAIQIPIPEVFSVLDVI